MFQHETKPRFIRVILPHILQNRTLELPRSFVKEHGKHLSIHARVKVPTCSESKMELKRCKGRAWLAKGWPDFVDTYSIESGHFLVFKYEGGSRFSVRIFDLSNSQIEYPVISARTSDKKAREPKVVEVKEEDDDDEILDECQLKLPKGSKPVDVASNVMHRILRSPGSFKIDMSPSYISCRANVPIPKDHSRRYLRDSKNGDDNMILHGSNGKNWPLKYRLYAKHSNRVAFVRGWKEFVSDNNLRVGDSCVFEMILHKVNEYKVTIFRSRARS